MPAVNSDSPIIEPVCFAGPSLNGVVQLWSTLTLIGMDGMVSQVREEKSSSEVGSIGV